MEFFERAHTELHLRQARSLLSAHLQGGHRPGRRRAGATADRRRHARCDDLRQDVGPARDRGAAHHADENLRMIRETVRYLKGHGRRSSTTPSTSSTATRQPGVRAFHPEGGDSGRRRRHRAVRHQRRQPALAGGRSGGRRADRSPGPGNAPRPAPSPLRTSPWASTPTTTARPASPTRWRRCVTAAPRCRAPSTATANAAATPT
jgi:hypothetical protein